MLFHKKYFLVLAFLIILLSSFGTLPAYAGAIPAAAASNTATLAPVLKNVLPCVVNIVVQGELLNANNIGSTLAPPNNDNDDSQDTNPNQNQNLNPQDKRLIPNNNPPPSPESPLPKPKNLTPLAQKFVAFGSGVIVDAEHGFILTNAHMIRDASVITVTLKDGRKTRARVIGFDVPTDLAVIQVNYKRLNAISFGDSDKLNVGDFVAAIGSPFGLQQTVTSGVISGLERNDLGIESYENFIQTDASINPGNSGGALINLQGELIGINTAIFSTNPIGANIGIGFAIPSNMAKSVMQQLIKYGKVERGVFGVMVQNLNPPLAEALHLADTNGALVSSLLPNSPAEKAGIKAKDVILTLNGKPVRSSFQLRNNISILRVGTPLVLTLKRDDKILTINSHVASLAEIEKSTTPPTPTKELFYGLSLRTFHAFVNNEEINGLEVLDMSDDSMAFSSGLRPGDIILTADNKPLTSMNDLENILKNKPSHLLLEVGRTGAGKLFMVMGG